MFNGENCIRCGIWAGLGDCYELGVRVGGMRGLISGNRRSMDMFKLLACKDIDGLWVKVIRWVRKLVEFALM